MRTACHLWLHRLLAIACVLIDPFRAPAWPGAPETARFASPALFRSRTAHAAPFHAEAATPDDAAIVAQPLCIVSKTDSFGTLGDSVLYVRSRQGKRLRVGYFVYWSAERPWGPNVQTYTLLPSLAIDTTYTHFLFVAPGLQRVLYGAGDVEGATIEYEVSEDGRLSVLGAFADGEGHGEVELQASELVTRDGRVALMTDVWSHQLGARDAGRHADRPGTYRVCFGGDRLRPLDAATAREFRLGSATHPLRARPAWRAVALSPAILARADHDHPERR